MKLSSRKQLLNEAEQEMKKIRGESKKIEEVAVINETARADRMIGELSKLDPGSKQFLKKLVGVLYEITAEIRSRAYGS
jgi:hypothetical protein